MRLKVCGRANEILLQKTIMVHDNKKIVVLGLKIAGKIWPIQKCSEAEKLTSKKKKLVERKRKLISASTGCNRAYSYIASQEVVLWLSARGQKQNGTLASKF